MNQRPLATSSPTESRTDTPKIGEVTRTKQKKTSLIKMSSGSVDITPVLYSFKTTQSPYPGSIMTASLPPYWLYHDHAFGVIWCLFHPDRKHIGISQLHWCLRFLMDLKSSNGEYTGDVKVCIQAIEDDLIEGYAKLGHVFAKQSESQAEEKGDESPDEKSIVKDVEQESTVLKGKKVPDETGKSKSNDEEGDSYLQKHPGDLSLYKRYFVTSLCGKLCGGKSDGKKKATSLTYEQMASRGSDPYAKKTEQQPTMFESKTSEVVEELSRKLNEVGLADLETEELLQFLNNCRQQHVEKIKKEIEKLHHLEKFMETIIDKNSFAAYITDDLAIRLDKLQGHDVVKGIEKIIK